MTATIPTAIVVAQAYRAVAMAGARSAAATAAKKSGNTAVMMVVWNAELAQSYIAHARSSRRSRPSRERIFTVNTFSSRSIREAASRPQRNAVPL